MGLRREIYDEAEVLRFYFALAHQGEISISELEDKVFEIIQRRGMQKGEDSLWHDVIQLYLREPKKRHENFEKAVERAKLGAFKKRKFYRLKEVIESVRLFYRDNPNGTIEELHDNFRPRDLPLISKETINLILNS